MFSVKSKAFTPIGFVLLVILNYILNLYMFLTRELVRKLKNNRNAFDGKTCVKIQVTLEKVMFRLSKVKFDEYFVCKNIINKAISWVVCNE